MLDNILSFVKGTAHLPPLNNPPKVITLAELETFRDLIIKYEYSSIFSQAIQPKEFFEAATDLKGKVEQSKQSELFYSLKNNFVVKGVPALIIYRCKQIHSVTGLCNSIWLHMSKKELETYFAANYFTEGYCLADVIRLFCDSNFIIIDESNKVMQTNNNIEYYAAPSVIYSIPLEMCKVYPPSNYKFIDNELIVTGG